MRILCVRTYPSKRVLHFPSKNSAYAPLSLSHIREYSSRSPSVRTFVSARDDNSGGRPVPRLRIAKTQISARMMNSRGCPINFIRTFNYADAFSSFCCHIAAVSRREAIRNRGRYSLSDIGRSESLICTVRILMDPDILCPAQVIPVGFKGTAGAGPVRTTRLLPVASAIKTPGPGLVVRRDKVNLRGTFVATCMPHRRSARRLPAFLLDTSVPISQ